MGVEDGGIAAGAGVPVGAGVSVGVGVGSGVGGGVGDGVGGGGGVGGGVGDGVGGGFGVGVGTGVGVGLWVGVGEGDGEGCGRAACTERTRVPVAMCPRAPHAAINTNAAASVSPRWRRSMPFPCLLPRMSGKQDTERDRKRTARGLVSATYH